MNEYNCAVCGKMAHYIKRRWRIRMINQKFLSSEYEHWGTPKDLYNKLDEVFGFNFDPCPFNPESNGLQSEWGTKTFINPPYSRQLGKWIDKAHTESQKGKIVVMLIPSRTDTRWFHKYYNKINILLIKGRLKFEKKGSNVEKKKWTSAFFPSALMIFGEIDEYDLSKLNKLGVWTKC